MAQDTHEQRFLDFTRFVLPGREVGQEVAIPRKTRRLDAVFHVQEPPGLFGPLGPVLRQRAIVFEHESGLVPRVGLRRAQVGGAWITWRHEVARVGDSNWGTPSEADAWLGAIELSPVVVVVADRVQRRAADRIPNLIEAGPGLWWSLGIEDGGMVVLDISRLPEQGGWSYWRLTSRGVTPEERERRVEALRTDEQLPKTEREALMEAIAMELIPTTLEEKRAALNRERQQAFKDGEARGRRGALLDAVAILAPEALPRLQAIEDLPTLEREARVVFEQRRS